MKNYPHFKIVILEDNDFYNRLITKHISNYLNRVALLKGFSFDVSSFTSYKECIRNFSNDINIIVTDYYLNDGYSALHILDLVKKRGAGTRVIVLSQIQNINTAICTILEGAYEFIPKNKKTLEKSGTMIEDIIMSDLQQHGTRPALN